MNRFNNVKLQDRLDHSKNLVMGMGCLLLTMGLLVSCGQGGTPSQQSAESSQSESVAASQGGGEQSAEESQPETGEQVPDAQDPNSESESSDLKADESQAVQEEMQPAQQEEITTEESATEGLSLEAADTEVQRAVEKFDIDLENVGEPMDEVTLVGRKLKFDKHVIVAKKGKPFTIHFKNDGFITHNVTVPEFNQKSETIQPHNTTSITFTPDQAGYHWFYCNVAQHKRAGMQGVFVVKN